MEDIQALAEYFLDEFSRRNNFRKRGFAKEATLLIRLPMARTTYFNIPVAQQVDHIITCYTANMEQSKNLTLHLPADLIRRAKVYAAQNDTSINSVVRELLEQKVSREDRMRLAADRILAVADQGPLTSGDPGGIRRETIYERG